MGIIEYYIYLKMSTAVKTLIPLEGVYLP